MNKLEIKNQIAIKASPEKIWRALIEPEQTKKYMFGCETVSDWKVGSPLIWKMIHEGKEFIPVKGTVTEFQPFRKLSYTVIDPHSNEIADVPENYLTVTYELKTESDGMTTLFVTQGDYSRVALGEKRYKETYNNGEGWNPILVEMKKIIEENYL